MSATTHTKVRSVRGGTAHLAQRLLEMPFPLCRTGGQSRNLTRYTDTQATVTCKTCIGYLEDAHERAIAMNSALAT